MIFVMVGYLSLQKRCGLHKTFHGWGSQLHEEKKEADFPNFLVKREGFFPLKPYALWSFVRVRMFRNRLGYWSPFCCCEIRPSWETLGSFFCTPIFFPLPIWLKFPNATRRWYMNCETAWHAFLKHVGVFANWMSASIRVLNGSSVFPTAESSQGFFESKHLFWHFFEPLSLAPDLQQGRATMAVFVNTGLKLASY